MIDMAARTEGIIAKMKREGIIEGEKNIILELLKTNTIEEVSSMIHRDIAEI